MAFVIANVSSELVAQQIMHRIDPAPETAKYGGYNSLSPGDFDKDGYDDYVVIHEFLGWVGVTILFHPGTEDAKLFGYWEKVEVHEGEHIEHASVGDFDKDGNLDILCLNGSEGKTKTVDVRILWGPKAEDAKNPEAWKDSMSFGAMGSKGGNVLFCTTHDIDGDGDLDFFVGGRGQKYSYSDPVSQGYFGMRWAECPSGDVRNREKWKTHAIDANLMSGHGHIFVDMDADGDDDIVVNNADFNTPPEDRELMWYENPGRDKISSPWMKHSIHKDPDYFMKAQVTSGDLDQDGMDDLLIPLGYAKILWFRRLNNKPEFERIEIVKPPAISQVQRPILIDDYNNDGRMDIIGAHLHYAYHTRYGNPEGYMSPTKTSVFWMEYKGDKPAAANWTAHCVKKAFGSNTGRGAQGEKYDNILLVDIDKDGDRDILLNTEESVGKIERGKVHTYMGVAWFENTETHTAAADNFENGKLDGGAGWRSPWKTTGPAKIVSRDIEGRSCIELRHKASIQRELETAIDDGQLEFRWRAQGGPREFHIDVFDGQWHKALTTHPIRREEDLPYKNEMLAISKYGPVTKVRISLVGATDENILYIDDVVIRKRTVEQ